MNEPDPDSPQNEVPRVWCLLGRKAGDNTQVRALADALGWPWEGKQIAARSWELLPHLLLGPTLAGIDRNASSALSPPWPDLIISAGRRNEPVARWVRGRSDGKTRLVHMGRPWAPLRHWDLIVTTPQYFLPERANVLHNRLPLHSAAAPGDAAAAQRWAGLWAPLPRPWIAVLLGGDSGPFVYTAAKAARLGRLASGLVAQAGGSLLISDSARTPASAGDALAETLTVPACYFRSRSARAWLTQPGAQAREAADGNPYSAILALADGFIVTGDSMSMLAEARDRGRPLWIFDPGDAAPWWRHAHAWRYKPLSHRLAMALGPRRMRRDVARIQQALIRSGEARFLDEQATVAPLSALRRRPAGESGIERLRAAEAVKELFHPRSR